MRKESKAMLDDKNSFNYDNRNLSDVFKELQAIRNNPQAQAEYAKQIKKTQKHKPKAKVKPTRVKNNSNVFASNFRTKDRTSKQKSNDLKKYYMASDLFVLATREDIWGLVVNEAMANALPVITTKKCGAGCTLIKNGYNGFLVENEDVKELSNRINELAESQELRLQCAKNALNTISEYTIENMVKAHMDVFKKIGKKKD